VTWSETGSGACQMAYSDTDFNINHVQPWGSVTRKLVTLLFFLKYVTRTLGLQQNDRAVMCSNIIILKWMQSIITRKLHKKEEWN
jgi:hypothetical protein